MLSTGGNEVDEAVASAVALLRSALDRDWAEINAGRLEELPPDGRARRQ